MTLPTSELGTLTMLYVCPRPPSPPRLGAHTRHPCWPLDCPTTHPAESCRQPCCSHGQHVPLARMPRGQPTPAHVHLSARPPHFPRGCTYPVVNRGPLGRYRAALVAMMAGAVFVQPENTADKAANFVHGICLVRAIREFYAEHGQRVGLSLTGVRLSSDALTWYVGDHQSRTHTTKLAGSEQTSLDFQATHKDLTGAGQGVDHAGHTRGARVLTAC